MDSLPPLVIAKLKCTKCNKKNDKYIAKDFATDDHPWMNEGTTTKDKVWCPNCHDSTIHVVGPHKDA